jgi:hypothetical protein
MISNLSLIPCEFHPFQSTKVAAFHIYSKERTLFLMIRFLYIRLRLDSKINNVIASCQLDPSCSSQFSLTACSSGPSMKPPNSQGVINWVHICCHNSDDRALPLSQWQVGPSK